MFIAESTENAIDVSDSRTCMAEGKTKRRVPTGFPMTRPIAHIAVASGVRLRLKGVRRVGRASQLTFGDGFQITIGGKVRCFVRRGGLRVHPSSVNNCIR